MLAAEGPAGLSALVGMSRPLGRVLVQERLANLPGQRAVAAAATIVAARPSTWEPAVGGIAAATCAPPGEVRRALLDAARAWNADPHGVAQQQLAGLREVRARMERRKGEPTSRHKEPDVSERLAGPEWKSSSPRQAVLISGLAGGPLTDVPCDGEVASWGVVVDLTGVKVADRERLVRWCGHHGAILTASPTARG